MAWSSHGVSGAGAKPAMAGTVAGGKLLVCGSGRTLWEDRAAMLAKGGGFSVLCVNFAGCFYPGPFQHWASLHAEHLAHWAAIRRRDYIGPHITIHAEKPEPAVEQLWPFDYNVGSSGAFGVLVGLAMGYDDIVLAGIPEDGAGHFYDPPGDAGTYTNTGAMEVWECLAHQTFAGRVKSLSGNTRDLLGAPS